MLSTGDMKMSNTLIKYRWYRWKWIGRSSKKYIKATEINWKAAKRGSCGSVGCGSLAPVAGNMLRNLSHALPNAPKSLPNAPSECLFNVWQNIKALRRWHLEHHMSSPSSRYLIFERRGIEVLDRSRRYESWYPQENPKNRIELRHQKFEAKLCLTFVKGKNCLCFLVTSKVVECIPRLLRILISKRQKKFNYFFLKFEKFLLLCTVQVRLPSYDG